MGKRRRVLVLAVVVALCRPLHGAPADAISSTPAAGPVLAGTVTLITGDRIQLTPVAGGGVAVGIQPGPGREHIGFFRSSIRRGVSEQITVLPSDAAPLVAAGRLDAALFDIAGLIRQGLDDGRHPVVPLIVTSTGSAAAASALASNAAGARTVRLLPSIDGAAVEADKRAAGAFWSALKAGVAAAPASRGAHGAVKVWLDGRAQPLLDQSAPQVGAPAAWRAGLTGKGVTVAVLDTGVNPDHPDLAGKIAEARDFTETLPDASDDVGHGTHVAGIIAGTGAASGGRYRGVAPDATLINGKVCMTFGCADSAIIAGMEWAAPRARIVNMSLGGAATDGSDPVSQALDRLSAEHGTLFVVSAGNTGLERNVSSPASADAALAVASVTKQGAMSDFSSRGPRLDYAIKPDIAAPGSLIVSARAAGTPVGDLDPVDAHYTRLSGTSMAAPHVAGAAAVLAEQHPDWTGAQLKAALVGTAAPIPGARIYDQGAGLLDIARAIGQPVAAATGHLDFGFFAWPHDQPPATRTVAYRNDGDAPITLSLALSMAGPDGRPAPAGMFKLGVAEVTVPAHGSAEASVGLNPAAGRIGLYGGLLTASSGPITVRTAVGAFEEPASYDVKLEVVSRTGSPDSANAMLVNVETGEAFDARFGNQGITTLRVPKGRYDVNAFDVSLDGSSSEQPFTLTLLSEPATAVEANTSVTLDARRGRPVDAVAADRPDAVRQFGELSLLSGAGGTGGTIAYFTRSFFQVFAAPTQRVTGHKYVYAFRATLSPSRPGRDPSAPVYNLVFWEEGRIPERLARRVRNCELAAVRTVYHTQGAATMGIRADYARLPERAAGSSSFPFWDHVFPSQRTEYYTASRDVNWFHLTVQFSPVGSGSEAMFSARSYEPIPYEVGWNRAPLGPAFGDPARGWGVFRTAEGISAALPLFSGSQDEQYTDSFTAGVAGATTLSRGGAVLGTSEQPGAGVFALPAGAAGLYTLSSTATRNVPWSVIGSRAEASWTFQAPAGGASAQPLPLMVVRAAGSVDLEGRAPAGRPLLLLLHVQRQPGAPAARVAQLGVEFSLDDGATWRDAALLLQHGDRAIALLRHPDADGFVSLRLQARDAAGNTVAHTVQRAYAIARTP